MLDLVKLNPQFPEYCRQAIAIWGPQAQLDMVIEECAELIDVLQKFRRSRAGTQDVILEAVDVRLMLAQLELILFPAPGVWETAATRQIEHLREKLKAASQPQGGE